MLALDLRWTLYGLLLSIAAALAAGWFLASRQPAKRPGLDLGSFSELDGAPFGLLLLKDGLCEYANVQARELLGLSGGGSVLPQTEWAAALAADCRAARRGGYDAGHYRSVSSGPGGSRSAGWWVAPLRERDLVFLLDLSGQRRAEESARTLLNDLSHELRTPLATMLTHLEVLSLPAIAQDARAQSVNLLKAEAQRMARLVHQMLELGRLETGAGLQRRPLDLLALAEEIVTQVRPRAEEKRIGLALEADTPLPLVLGDTDRLRQVLLNLLDNAIKYSRPGDRVAVSLQRADAGIRCAVRDSGPGVPAQHLPFLGRRFYRAAAPLEVEGSGLGLAMAAEILRRHGAALEIESCAEGEETGTSVAFVLPAAGELWG